MKIEIRKEVRDYILNDVNTTLARLGVSERVNETEERVDKFSDRLEYMFKSAAIKQMPMMFKKLYVYGHMVCENFAKNESHRFFNLAQNNDIVIVTFSYGYDHFEGGSNGCDIGYMVYAVNKNLPKSFETDFTEDGRSWFVRKIEGLSI